MENDPVFEQRVRDGLVWLPEHGMGRFPVSLPDTDVYDAAYWDKYLGYATTPLGLAINAARLELLDKWCPKYSPVVDVGIGCGQFVNAAREIGWQAFGFDVNPIGVEWLRRRGWLVDPYQNLMTVATFWDTIEHLKNPAAVLANVLDTVLVSLPIFADGEHVLRSKHFRRDEHRWYWTTDGFVSYMEECGFGLLERLPMETELGREDIGTFVFRRL